MDRYQFSPQERATLEGLRHPLAIYQFLDRRVVTLILSDGFCKLFGYEDRAEAYHDMDNNMYKDTHPDDAARIANAAFRFATEGGRYEVIYRTKARDRGGYRVIHALGEHVHTDTGVRLAHVWYTDEGMYVEGGDPSDTALGQSLGKALHEESIVRASQYDFLTGLPSMTYFFELAEAGSQSVRRAGGVPVLMYMDFRGMKFYNTRHGFAEGDKLLQAFAKTLAEVFGNEHCCHIGADHFAVQSEAAGLEERLQRLFDRCRETGANRQLPIHVGIYRGVQESVHTSVACDRAKLACNALRGWYETAVNDYNDDLRDDVERRQYIVENLDRAIEEKWIQVHYQPIVRAVTERVCDEEALARWIDPVRGFLSPADFIPALEESGLIYKLDLYVLDQVLEKIRRQAKTGLYVVPHSINLSRSDFEGCDIVEEIRRRVDAAGVPRDGITIEITESVIGSDFDFIREQVERFRSLGFPVWMDDFGSGYSSLDVLQSVRFDLIKFDMSFMRKLDQGDSGKIILTELMKMATALGVDTVCEGVETEAQVRFLQEIGCSKLQGFYYCKAIPLEQIVERNRKGIQIGYENPDEADYYETIGRVNLYDLAVIANEESNALQKSFNTIPMSVIEVRGDSVRFVRSNQSFRDFLKRFFGYDLSDEGSAFEKHSAAFMRSAVKACCGQDARAFYDEKMPDGSVVHSFARRIDANPVNGNTAVVIAVLSISEPNEGTTYADIARALAADYYNIYVVDLDTDRFIEYTSPVGGEELAMERHGSDFFESAKRDTMVRIYEEDRDSFLMWFSKENIVRELDEQGVFTTTYRLVDTGAPLYCNMKVMRMQPGSRRIIMGISIIDSQMKQREAYERIEKERNALARVMALSEDYLSLYSVDPETGRYVEYNSTDDYKTLGLNKGGEDFFRQSIIDAKKTFHPDDLPRFLQEFSREKILREINENRIFKLQYRLLINGQPTPVSLRIARYREGSEEKLVAGVRAWKARK